MGSGEWVGIHIDDLVNQTVVISNIYLKLSEEKYVVVAKAGSNLSVEHMDRLRSRGVEVLYARSDEHNSAFAGALRMASEVVRGSQSSLIPKLLVLLNVTEALFAELARTGITPENFARSRAHADNIALTVLAGLTLAELVEFMKNKDAGPSAHALQVALVAALMGQEAGWRNPIVMERLIVAGLLHDLGALKFQASLFSQAPSELGANERALYESHPQIGRDLLAQSYIPVDVSMLVYEHHENANGTGFPEGKKDEFQHPLSRTLALANAFSELVFPRLSGAPPVSPQEALYHLEITLGQPYNGAAFSTLTRLVS